MIIGGLQKFSLSDFPGRISAIVFTRGCNFRCPWCHNPELVDPTRYAAAIPRGEILAFLSARKSALQGVVITGGEPLLHKDLADFLGEVRAMGLATKLDTNGSMPAELESVLSGGLVDYVAMDLKAPWVAYPRLTGVAADTGAIARSLQLLREGGIRCEIRTTYAPGILGLDELRDLAFMVKGFKRFYLQSFRSTGTLDPSLAAGQPSAAQTEGARLVFESAGIPVRVR